MPFFPAHIENKSVLPLHEGSDAENLHGGEAQQTVGGSIGYSVPLSLDDALISNPASTYFARVQDSDHDLLIIDRSAPIVDGALVVAYIEDEFVLKRVSIDPEEELTTLCGEGAEPTVMSENITLWGRVVYYIKRF